MAPRTRLTDAGSEASMDWSASYERRAEGLAGADESSSSSAPSSKGELPMDGEARDPGAKPACERNGDFWADPKDPCRDRMAARREMAGDECDRAWPPPPELSSLICRSRVWTTGDAARDEAWEDGVLVDRCIIENWCMPAGPAESGLCTEICGDTLPDMFPDTSADHDAGPPPLPPPPPPPLPPIPAEGESRCWEGDEEWGG